MNMDPDSRWLDYVRACFQTGRGRGDFGGIGSAAVSRNVWRFRRLARAFKSH
jgi:hypothetical protein